MQHTRRYKHRKFCLAKCFWIQIWVFVQACACMDLIWTKNGFLLTSSMTFCGNLLGTCFVLFHPLGTSQHMVSPCVSLSLSTSTDHGSCQQSLVHSEKNISESGFLIDNHPTTTYLIVGGFKLLYSSKNGMMTPATSRHWGWVVHGWKMLNDETSWSQVG